MQDFTISELVLDAAPLLSTAANASTSSLRGLADKFITTPDVLAEIKDKTSRELLSNTLQLLGVDNTDQANGGLQVKEPSAEAVSKVTAFARLTGDVSVLSQADIRVLALTYDLEVERNGTRRLRDAPGKPSLEEREREQKTKERLAQKEAEAQMKNLDVKGVTQPENPTSSAQIDAGTFKNAEPVELQESQEHGSPVEDDDQAQTAEFSIVPASRASTSQLPSAEEEHIADDSDSDDEGATEWITPANVTLHKSRDFGLFPDLATSAKDSSVQSLAKKPKKKTVLKVACLTGDYAMQNVALQMGLNVFGVGGKKIKEVKTWVLRCHACFKLCKDPTKKFCPSCGGPSLIRTSVTYVTPSPENPKGYVLHLKSNFQFRSRGTQFSIPNPKQGSSNAMKNSKNAELILREDQKEYVRGVKRAEIAKSKQERAAAKAMKEGKSSNLFGGYDDIDWSPAMLMGEKGRSGGQPGVRTGKDGLPIIGYGGRNPNVSRRRKA